MMSCFVFRWFARSSVSYLRTYTFVTQNTFKMSPSMHKCFKSTTIDQSQLSTSLSTDDFDFDEESPISPVDVDAITEGDPNKQKALKALQLQVEVMKLQELEMPSSLSTENWKELMILPTLNQRRKLLRRLWVKEMRTVTKANNKREKQMLYKKFKASLTTDEKVLTTSSPIEYGLKNSCLFTMFRDQTINQFYNYKLFQAEWFGPRIVVDCGYDSFMSPKNLGICAKELMMAWSTNRENFNPFDVFFCNLDQNGPLWPKFLKVQPSLNLPNCPVHHTDKHYLKYFPKEKLVYLTPHCREVLEDFNPDDIYIIGAYVDFGSVEQLSLAKAKKEGLRKAKLPLDKYLKWKQGPKSLTIYTVLAIMNELKDGHSWPEALKHVPKKRVAHDIDVDTSKPEKINRLTPEYVREIYRKNLVYDLLLDKKFKRPQ